MEVDDTLADRQSKYGHPANHFGRTAGMLSALGVRIWDDTIKEYRNIGAEDWGRFMILDKIARDIGPDFDPDNIHDVSGYAKCIEMVRDYYQEESKR